MYKRQPTKHDGRAVLFAVAELFVVVVIVVVVLVIIVVIVISTRSPRCELQTVGAEFDAFSVSTVVVVVVVIVAVVVVVLVVVRRHPAVICRLSMKSTRVHHQYRL